MFYQIFDEYRKRLYKGNTLPRKVIAPFFLVVLLLCSSIYFVDYVITGKGKDNLTLFISLLVLFLLAFCASFAYLVVVVIKVKATQHSDAYNYFARISSLRKMLSEYKYASYAQPEGNGSESNIVTPKFLCNIADINRLIAECDRFIATPFFPPLLIKPISYLCTLAIGVLFGAIKPDSNTPEAITGFLEIFGLLIAIVAFFFLCANTIQVLANAIYLPKKDAAKALKEDLLYIKDQIANQKN